MAKYVETGMPQKTVGAYLKVVKALNELHALGEELWVNEPDVRIIGITGTIEQDPDTGVWSFVQA